MAISPPRGIARSRWSSNTYPSSCADPALRTARSSCRPVYRSASDRYVPREREARGPTARSRVGVQDPDRVDAEVADDDVGRTVPVEIAHREPPCGRTRTERNIH